MGADMRVGNTKAGAIMDRAFSAEVDSNAVTTTLVATVTVVLAAWSKTTGEVVNKAVMVYRLPEASSKTKEWA